MGDAGGVTLLWRFRACGYPRAMLKLLCALAAFLPFVACGGSDGDGDATSEPASAAPTREITVSSGEVTEELTVELATSPAERQKGLMDRMEMDEDRGMLFLFPGAQGKGHGFWMRNTYIPLTIAYLDQDGTVLALMDGTPLDETVLRPGVAYYAVLEVNQGWFERRGLGVGSVVDLPDDAPAPT